MDSPPPGGTGLPRFGRRFLAGPETFTSIGSGAVGGKASGLRLAHETLAVRPDALRFPDLEIAVPSLTVLATDAFDLFLERNGLGGLAASDADDHRIALAFQGGELPAELVGDLWALVSEVRAPLAIRSSSLLEDALEHPFAGVYATKMIPNQAHDPQTRFRRLAEAIRFVYASTFFRGARAHLRAAGRPPGSEKMAVIVQQVVGRQHGPRHYPDVSGVARSWNFYPTGSARPEEGVMDLALGLGKTIVDGGRAWTCSPAHPEVGPPFNSVDHLLQETQDGFWAVHMGPPPPHDPTAETEYLVRSGLREAEEDDVLARVASSYDADADRFRPGLGAAGPRVVDFAPLLRYPQWPVAEAVRGLLGLFAERLGEAVEIEFALTLPAAHGGPARLGFLQVRPMRVDTAEVEIPDALLSHPEVLVRAARVMGHGRVDGVRDVVYVKPGAFEARWTPVVAEEVETMNRALVEEGRPYLLVGIGRWGSSDPWLGIPVAWDQISGARAIVETGLPSMNVEMSQGAHFFHNLLSFRVPYLSVPEGGSGTLDWGWLDALPARRETTFVRHVETPEPLGIRVDGRRGRGVVLRRAGGEA
jgi:hypothetical protein